MGLNLPLISDHIPFSFTHQQQGKSQDLKMEVLKLVLSQY